MPKATPIKATEELAMKLVHAQMAHTASLITNPYNRFGDDWGDYTCSALDCATTLFNIVWDQMDLEGLAKWLNTPQSEVLDGGQIDLPQSGGLHTHLGMCACDGICQELYDLNPIALEDE